MKRHRTTFAALAAAVFTLTLGLTTATEAAADVSIRFSTGPSGHAHHHRPRYSHGVPFITRRPLHGRHRHRPYRGHGRRSRHVLGSGCSPATQRYRDHHGRLVIHHVTVCYDRYGRPYVLGGAP